MALMGCEEKSGLGSSPNNLVACRLMRSSGGLGLSLNKLIFSISPLNFFSGSWLDDMCILVYLTKNGTMRAWAKLFRPQEMLGHPTIFVLTCLRHEKYFKIK